MILKYIILAFILIENALSCDDIKFGSSSFARKCSSSSSALPGRPLQAIPGHIVTSTSSRDQHRFFQQIKPFNVQQRDDAIEVVLNSFYEYQTIKGFGGAFTDSAGINIFSVSEDIRNDIMNLYFSEAGNGYNLCRTPIAGSDFSVRPYSYDDTPNDETLSEFALATEDIMYKIPLIKQAMNISERTVLIFGSPWSPPAWMKTNGKFNESGEVLPQYWQLWADYFVKFVEAYEASGVPIWGLTPQNEPLSGYDPNWAWNTCGWTKFTMRDWIKTNLGPTLEAAGMRRLMMMVDDFNRATVPSYNQPMLEDPESNAYIDGVAVHWYDDKVIGPEVLLEQHTLFPDKFILYTEACAGWDVTGNGSVILGSWERGEDYITNIIENSNHFSTGWVDWNLALDMDGGPNWADNYVDAPIIIDEENNEYYIQPTYYALGHFSRDVLPGAKGIYSEVYGNDTIRATAFLGTTQDEIVIILANLSEEPANLSIRDQFGIVTVELLEGKTWRTIKYLQNNNPTTAATMSTFPSTANIN